MNQKAKGRACTVIVTSEEREEKGEQPGDRESWLGARGKGWHMGTAVSIPGGGDAGRTAANST